jgi:tetratricopeptide (TPR) repeat protein
MSSRDAESAALYDRGLVELRHYMTDFDDADLARAVGYFRTATQLSPGNANYWVGLGFALDTKAEYNAALTAMRRATELDPADEEAKVFVLTLLAEAGLETEALPATEELAARTGVDIELLRRDLVAAGMPVDARTILSNGFLHPRNFVRSRLEDAADRAERSIASWDSHLEADLEDCHDRRAELEREVELDRVPPNLRDLVPWVLRLGVGDDPCRAILIDELTQDERDEALQDFREYASAVHAWLDSFGEGSLPPEAAAFMYALLAAEEMNGRRPNESRDNL